MTRIEMKNKYEANKDAYIVMFKQKKIPKWGKCYRPSDLTWRHDFDYKLINKKHENILDAYIERKYQIGLNGSFVNNFIDTYNEKNDYVIMYLYPIK